MINISQTFSFQGQGPFTYLFTSNNASVGFSSVSGTTTSTTLQVTFSFPTEAILLSSTVTLNVTSACGNSNQHTVIIPNPCDTFSVSPISFTVDGTELIFIATANNQGCSDLNYVWSYDMSNYQIVTQLDGSTQSSLRLRKLNTTTTSSIVSLVVTNPCNGCVKTRTYTVTPCVPVAPDVNFTFSRDKGNNLNPVTRSFTAPTGCADFVVDWNTIVIDLPAGFTYTVSGNNITITPPANPPLTNYTGTYTVDGTNGVTSTIGNINIGVQPVAGTGSTINIPNTVISLDCDVEEDDIVSIPIEGITTAPGAAVDWTTFQVLSSPAPIGTVSGTIVFGVGLGPGAPPIPYIEYTVPAGFVQDAFAFTVADTNGNFMTSTVFTLTECTVAPVAVDNAFTIACGDLEVFDVVANDTSADSPSDRSSVVITQAPLYGSHTVNGVTGNITYQADAGFAGTDIIKYTVANVSGGVSNVATVTITIICAGVNQSVVVCE
jgi:hypothetical protein